MIKNNTVQQGGWNKIRYDGMAWDGRRGVRMRNRVLIRRVELKLVNWSQTKNTIHYNTAPFIVERDTASFLVAV